MPDLIVVFARRWKFILLFTLVAALLVFLLTMLKPVKYLSTATALPVNVMTNERSRIFGENIQVLYSDFGTPDELDKLEGTAALDTIYLATAQELNLAAHYKIDAGNETLINAANKLHKNSKIARSAYGELKVKVWDENNAVAASAANTLLQKLQSLHQRLQNENSLLILQRLKMAGKEKEAQYRALSDSAAAASGASAELLNARKAALLQQVQQYENLVDQYSITVNSNPQVLLTVETAKPSPWADRSKQIPAILIVTFAAFVFSFLLSLYLESRKKLQ